MEEIFSPSSARSIQLQNEVDEKSRFPSLRFSSVALGHPPREYWVWTESPTLLDFFKEFIMPSPDSKTRARTELIHLIQSQVHTLEKETYGSVTEAELREYEDRCDRIRQLYAQLSDNQEAAA